MADETKKVLIDVIVETSAALKNIAELRAQSNSLKQQQKELDLTTEEGAVAYEQLAVQIKQVNAAMSQQQKEVTKSIQLENMEVGSLDSLKAQIALATKAYDSMSEAKRKGAEGQALQKFIKETSDALKAEKKELGDTRLEVGNYQEAIEKALAKQGLAPAILSQANKSLQEMRNELKALQSIPFEGLTSEDAQKIKENIADVKASIDDYREEIKSLDTGNVFSNLIEGANVAVATVTVMTQGLRALGVENETLEKVNNATMQLIATMQALGVITEYLEKQKYRAVAANIANLNSTIRESVANALNAATLRAQTTAENASTVAKIKGAVATKLVTVAQWLWNAALYANPVVAIVIAIAALVAGLILLAKWLGGSSKEADAAAKSQKAYEDSLKETEKALAQLDVAQTNRMAKMKNANDKEINELRKNGATKEELAQKQYELDKKVRDAEISNIEERLKKQESLAKANKKVIDDKNALLATYDKESKKYKKLKEEIDQLDAAYLNLTKDINDANNQIAAAQNANDKAELDRIENQKKERKDAADKALALEEKILERTKKIQESALAASAQAQATDFTSQQAHAKAVFELNQKSAKDKLDLQLKYGKISQAAYKDELTILANQQTAFNNQQLAAANKHQQDMVKEIQGLLEQSVDQQLAAVDQKYADAIDKLKNEIKIPVRLGQTDEEFAKELEAYNQLVFDAGQTEIALLRQQEKEKEAIRKAGIVKSISEIETEVKEHYNDDLQQYSDNERKKLETTISMLEEQIRKKKEAGLNTYADEVALRQAEAQLVTHNASIELLQANLTAQQRYDIKKKEIEDLKALYADNADYIKELEAQELENYQTLQQEKIKSFEDFAAGAMEGLSALNDLISAMGQREISEAEDKNAKEKAALDDRLKKGLISQADYDKQTAKMDADLDKKKAEIARQAAIREKTMQALQIGINTAAAIMKNTAQLGLIPAIPVNIATGELGAIQLAAVLATPLPKAAKGKYLNGPSHAAGGIAIEAEGGETIINKASSKMFLPLLSAINEMGGGVPFVSPNGDGGFAVRTNAPASSVSTEDLTAAFTDAASSIKIYTTVEDIRQADKNYTDIEAVGTI